MSATDQRAQIAGLRLARTRGIGPISWRQLVRRFGSADVAIDALPDLVARVGGRKLVPPSPAAIEQEMAATAALGGRYVLAGDADFPGLLDQSNGAPAALIVAGQVAHWTKPCLAVVGARNASAAACRFARSLCADIAASGITIVSGLARGVDTAAHIGSFDHATIGVIASGMDIAFPPENRELQARIVETHLLVTEYAPGTEPLARQFPHRNRIIAGLSLGTLVVEAAPRSGSLLTARLAADMGREVMAVPGSPLDPRAQGCNLLIREGATLIQTADDVRECLRLDAWQPRVAAPRQPAPELAGPHHEPDDADRAAVLALLGPVPVTVDELARQAGCAIDIVQSVLLDLELGGRITPHAGGRVALVMA